MLKKSTHIYNSILICLFIVILFWIIQIMNDYIPFIDQWISYYVEPLNDSNILYNVALIVTDLGSGYLLIPFTIIFGVVLLWMFRSVMPSIIFLIGTYTTHLINVYIKSVILRERPRIFIEANAEGYSFPSGHAMISIVCYGLIMYFLMQRFPRQKRMINVLFILLISIVGVSRVVINVHYPTDVITGFFLGYLLLLGWIYIYELTNTENYTNRQKT